MNRLYRLIFVVAALLAPGLVSAQEVPAGAAAGPVPQPAANDFLEHVVDWVLTRFGVTLEGHNTTTHFVVSAVFLLAAFLLRRAVTNVIFHFLKKAAARTETTLDDKLFPALEAPVATFIMVTGIFASMKVLKLSESADTYIGYGATVAFSLVIFWGLFRAFSALLDHAQEIAVEKQMGVAAFMPWIRKTLVAVFVIVGALLTIQSLGYDVKTLLAGLGIGGLAFALAAQDTIANLFGSIVVAIDQPFKVGETVRIGSNTGTVEEIGLRSTRIRLVDKSLVAIPNRAVSNEPIVNLSRFTGRRSEQVFGLTYDTTPEQMEAMVAEVRRIITAEPDVDPASVLVFFRDLNASSLDIWSVYVTRSPDNNAHLAVRQRINLAIMRAVAARGLSFAFPTQTVIHDGPVAKKIAEKP
jgi:MscS family membrane protein